MVEFVWDSILHEFSLLIDNKYADYEKVNSFPRIYSGFYDCKGSTRFFTKDAKINFNSSTPLEDIIAESNQATTFIDIDKNEIVLLSPYNLL